MKNKAAVNDGLIFSGCILVSSTISYFLMGLDGASWAAIACIYAFNLFNAQNAFKNYYYVGIGFILILISASIGFFFKIGIPFYITLTIFSFFYYQMYGKDQMLDLTMKFMILMSIIASVLPQVDFIMLTAFFIGSTITTFTCYILSQKSPLNLKFITSLLDKSLFKFPQYIFYRALIFSIGLLASLIIPLYLELNHFYWTTLTYIFVLHPKTLKIMTITFERILGCFLSVVMLYLLLKLPFMPYSGIVLVLISAFLLPISYQYSYIIITFVTTTLILSIFKLITYSETLQTGLLIERIMETILGGIIAIVISFILKLFRDKAVALNNELN